MNTLITFHIYTPIESVEKMEDRELEELFGGSAKDTRQQLMAMKSIGMEVVPAGACDNYDKVGKCLGHKNRMSEI